MNILSRIFFQDFLSILPQYEFYRILPFSLLPLRGYSPLYNNIFAYQNIVAVRKGFSKFYGIN